MSLTVRENGVRVANPIFRGKEVHGEDIKQYHRTLLEELGFKEYVHKWIHLSGDDFDASTSLCAVWEEVPYYTLSIQRGGFIKSLRIRRAYDLYDFVSEVIRSIREVWVKSEGEQT